MTMATHKVFAMLGNESLWETTLRCRDLFQQANLPHSICGGVAVCLHGYQRNTTDLDMIIRPEDSARAKSLLMDAGFRWDEVNREFCGPSGVVLQFLLSGSKAGKDSEVAIPEPVGEANVEEREGVLVVKLSRLIEMKIACGMGSLRRTHKDFADVVELINVRKLDKSFVCFLHKSVQDTFRSLVDCASAED